MDYRKIVNHLGENGKKYLIPVLILFLGIILMTLPGKEKTEAEPIQKEESEINQTELQDALEEILCLIQGAGKVRVLLTEAAGKRTIYQTDDDTQINGESENIRQDTVLLTDSHRDQVGLVRQTIPPIYQGAIILCQGADSAAVRLAIIQAVAGATGLTSDRITVLKMK